MRKGLSVIIMLCLALMVSSCATNEGMIPLMSAGDNTNTVGSCVAHIDEVKSSSSLTIMTTPTVEELLNAALEVPAISNSTKKRINIILDFLPELGGWLADIPDGTSQAIDEIMGNVTELDTVPQAETFLQDAIDSGQYDGYEWLPKALQFGKLLLEDGANTIYNPEWFPYTQSPLNESFNVTQLWKEGLAGGIAGAVGCALAGIAPDDYGVKIGGVVGAVDSSIADLIGQLADWW
jgi:hypothetical protein